jgi:hypothetical protein
VAELEHLMESGVGDPHVVLAVHRQAMRHAEHPVTPRGHDLSRVPIETEDGTVSPVKDENVIVRIHLHAGNLPQSKTLG